ncbi:MAG TPA: hypothetical protein VF763_04695 [Candidatus Limnocylindrales bacterium]
MDGVTVLVFHRPAAPAAGPLERLLADARARLAEDQTGAWRRAGARRVELVAATDDRPFGQRLREATANRRDGIVVLGSGALALARLTDLRRFVAAAADAHGPALANNRYSADVVALPAGRDLAGLPDLPADNALPRWLEERQALRVVDRRSSWRLQVDLDGPADLVLLAAAGRCPAGLRPLAAAVAETAPGFGQRLAAVAAVLADRRAELLVAGRVSSRGLAWLERRAACRVRALVEERGLRASARLALGDEGSPDRPILPAPREPRPPRSILGELLERDGPAALGSLLARLADAAIVDSRVLLAHRCGADEAAWPSPEDRYASDLLLAERVVDPWLRDLTVAAAGAPLPVLLGGHSLVGPGLRLLARAR